MKKQTASEYNQALVAKYRASGQEWPATARAIAEWAVTKRLWVPKPSLLVNQCAEEIARAMREEYYVDPQGRKVRTKHAARVGTGGEQQTLWADIQTAPRSHLAIAFAQRREGIFGDCIQLKTDVDSFNTKRPTERPIPMSFDFTEDLREHEAGREHDKDAA